ncbi:MAG TPA: sigma factor-like helix-turn-helix DNA-binding protein [Kofleriaceae bacterium]
MSTRSVMIVDDGAGQLRSGTAGDKLETGADLATDASSAQQGSEWDVGGRENAGTRKGARRTPMREGEESDGRVSNESDRDIEPGRRRLAEGTGVMKAIAVDAKPSGARTRSRSQATSASSSEAVVLATIEAARLKSEASEATRPKSPIEAIGEAARQKVIELKAMGVRMDAAVANARITELEPGKLSMFDALSSLILRTDVGRAAVRTEPTRMAPTPVKPMRMEDARLETLRTELARGSSPDLTAQLTLDSDVELRADAEALDLDLDIADGVEVTEGDDLEDEVLEASENEDIAPASSKRVRRRTKRNRPRSKTIAMKRVTRAELQAGALLYPPVDDIERPKTRAQCMEEARPCPWVSCKHHLYLDINPETGSIKINFPDLEPWEMQHTCSLDVAENGALTLEEIGIITNLTRERIRQVEVRGLLKLQGRRELR